MGNPQQFLSILISLVHVGYRVNGLDPGPHGPGPYYAAHVKHQHLDKNPRHYHHYHFQPYKLVPYDGVPSSDDQHGQAPQLEEHIKSPYRLVPLVPDPRDSGHLIPDHIQHPHHDKDPQLEGYHELSYVNSPYEYKLVPLVPDPRDSGHFVPKIPQHHLEHHDKDPHPEEHHELKKYAKSPYKLVPLVPDHRDNGHLVQENLQYPHHDKELNYAKSPYKLVPLVPDPRDSGHLVPKIPQHHDKDPHPEGYHELKYAKSPYKLMPLVPDQRDKGHLVPMKPQYHHAHLEAIQHNVPNHRYLEDHHHHHHPLSGLVPLDVIPNPDHEHHEFPVPQVHPHLEQVHPFLVHSQEHPVQVERYKHHSTDIIHLNSLPHSSSVHHDQPLYPPHHRPYKASHSGHIFPMIPQPNLSLSNPLEYHLDPNIYPAYQRVDYGYGHQVVKDGLQPLPQADHHADHASPLPVIEGLTEP